MRVRDKRKQQKEQKAQKQSDKQKSTEPEAKPAPAAVAAAAAATKTTTTTAAAATATASPTTTTSQSQSQQPPTLPATEKVAFDNRIKRKNVLALNEKVAALREYDRQPVYKHVGRLFNCSPDQIKRIVQQRDEILRAWEQRTRRSQDAKTQELKVVRVSMLGKAVYDWIRRMMYYKDFIISDGLIQKMALQFKSSMGLNNFFPHQEWCDKFRSTYNIQHNDTKLLKFGYTQSYSVQINDIAKDVMAQCTQGADAAGDAAADDENEDVSLATVSASSSHGDEDEADVDIDGGGDLTDPEDGDDDDDTRDVKPSISELQQTRVLQPLPQLMRLPQVPPGTSQKVLLATPILPPGAAPGGAHTMTIIPLATLAQSITQRPVATPPKTAMPPPMLDIKQEIKAEPKDTDEEEQEQEQEPEPQPEPAKTVVEPAQQKPVEEAQIEEEEAPVRIKQELDSDGEAIEDDDDDDGRCSVTSLAEILAANVDDEKQYIEQTRAMRHRKRTPSPAKDLATPLTILPPMPTLIKAPTSMTTPPAKRQRHADDNNNAGSASGQSIITCAEARKYLKQLEEFALCKENYRLIELFTRADEVMRELADE